jgi:hypothetical protein
MNSSWCPWSIPVTEGLRNRRLIGLNIYPPVVARQRLCIQPVVASQGVFKNLLVSTAA